MNDRLQDMLDVALQDSFPASDPPFFMAGAVVVGGPSDGRQEALGTEAGNRLGRQPNRDLSRSRGRAAAPPRQSIASAAPTP